MAGPKTKKARPKMEEGMPSGLLYNPLKEYWDRLPPEVTSSMSVIRAAAAGTGFHAMRGQGCDAFGTTGRCGERTCSYFTYVLEKGGVTIGVRACSDHLDIAREEPMWRRTEVKMDAFAVWEVMTT